MIIKTINNESLGIVNGTIQFPNGYCFVFNPNYIFVELGTNIPYVQVEIIDGTTSYSIACNLFKGGGRCYISKLMELVFQYDHLTKRSAEITMNVCALSGEKIVLASCTTIAIWGSMKVGDTFGCGKMEEITSSNHARFVREVRHYTGFPFKVSMFSPSADKPLKKKMGYQSEITEQETTKAGIFDIDLTSDNSIAETQYKIEVESETIKSTFTNVFDKTFTGSIYRYVDEIVKVRPHRDKEGYYLRWIDEYGFLEYWLFKKSTLINKNKLDSTSIETDVAVDGVYYPNHERTIHVENGRTFKCGAVNLTSGEYDTVATVLSSPHIDLFVGYSLEKEEIWLPINVVAGSYKKDETKELQDFELQITLPDTSSQTL